jgi:hypothetical protein
MCDKKSLFQSRTIGDLPLCVNEEGHRYVVEPDLGEKMKSMLPGKNRIERSGPGLFLPEGREIEEIMETQ